MISIVMAYYNRLPQLRFTLQTITNSAYKDVEVVIVDDFSDADNSLDSIPTEFPQLQFNIIRMRERVAKKDYCNPCVPYNVGLRASRGDMIVIQNPECCHMGDILSYVAENLTDENYLSFHCWACTKQDVTVLHQQGSIPTVSTSKKARWYNHKTERPVAFHFCNAISRNNLIKVNGFDERYATGHNWDDAELLYRIKQVCNLEFVANPMVIHQYHHKSYGHPDNIEPDQNNKDLYFNITVDGPIYAPNKESIQ